MIQFVLIIIKQNNKEENNIKSDTLQFVILFQLHFKINKYCFIKYLVITQLIYNKSWSTLYFLQFWHSFYQCERNSVGLRDEQCSEQDRNFEKENNMQFPPFKTYVLGAEKKQNQQQMNVDAQEKYSISNKPRIFGRVLQNNTNFPQKNSMFQGHAQTQPIQKSYKNEYPDINQIKEQNILKNKENVYNLEGQNCNNNKNQQKDKQNDMMENENNSLNNNQMVNEGEEQISEKENSQKIKESENPKLVAQQQNVSSKIKELHKAQKVLQLQQISEKNSQILQEYQQNKTNQFDKESLKDPVQVSEYSQSIFEYLKSHQDRYFCKDKIELSKMHSQLNDTMRCLLIDWLIEVALKYELKEETQFLCVQLIDIYSRLCYQENTQISRGNYQKVGVCCLYIASKIEEIYPPGPDEFVSVCDGAYLQKELIEQEVDICLKISFDFSFPTPYTFYLRYSKVLGYTQLQNNQGLFILYICLMHNELSPVYNKPSILACCSCFIVENSTEGEWDEKIKKFEQEFNYLISSIVKMIKFFKNPSLPFHAIRKKFSQETYGNITSLLGSDSQAKTQNIQ